MTDLLANVGNSIVDDIIMEVAADVFNALQNVPLPHAAPIQELRPTQMDVSNPVPIPDQIAIQMQDNSSGITAKSSSTVVIIYIMTLHNVARFPLARFPWAACVNTLFENINEIIVVYSINNVKTLIKISV